MGSICVCIFFEEGHSGLKYYLAQVIDVTDLNNLMERQSFRIEKLKSYVLVGLNVREES